MKSSVLTPAATFALSFNVMDGRLRWIALAARLFLLVNAEFPKAEGLASRIDDEVFKNRLFHLSARGFKNHPTAAAQKGSDLENPTSTAAAESSSTGLIIGIVIAILSVLILIGIALGVYFFILKKKKTTASAPEDPESPGEKTPANAKSPPKSSKKEESKMTSSGKTTASAKDKKSADTTELVNNDAHSKFAASFNGFKTVE